MIWGSATIEYVSNRLTDGKLTCFKCGNKCEVIDVENGTDEDGRRVTFVTEACPQCQKEYFHRRSPAVPDDIVDELPKKPKQGEFSL